MIKVNKEVKKHLDMINSKEGLSTQEKVFEFITNAKQSEVGLDDYFRSNNITISKIEDAFLNGYETEYMYTFKPGDVVVGLHEGLVLAYGEVVLKTEDIDQHFQFSNEYMDNDTTNNGAEYKLVCRKQNRRDLISA